jgi:hypothetical protein
MIVVRRKTARIVHLQGARQADRPVEMFRNAILSSESPRNGQLSSAISAKPHLHWSSNLGCFYHFPHATPSTKLLRDHQVISLWQILAR